MILRPKAVWLDEEEHYGATLEVEVSDKGELAVHVVIPRADSVSRSRSHRLSVYFDGTGTGTLGATVLTHGEHLDDPV